MYMSANDHSSKNDIGVCPCSASPGKKTIQQGSDKPKRAPTFLRTSAGASCCCPNPGFLTAGFPPLLGRKPHPVPHITQVRRYANWVPETALDFFRPKDISRPLRVKLSALRPKYVPSARDSQDSQSQENNRDDLSKARRIARAVIDISPSLPRNTGGTGLACTRQG